MLYIHVCLSRSRLCHAFCLLWAYACWSLGSLTYVVAFVLLVACLDVTTGETHLCDVGVLDTHLSPFHAMILCLPCLLFATYLAFFASLHLCMLAYMFMHESLLACVIKPNSYYLVRVHTRLWYTRPRVPLGILLDGTCVIHTPISWNYGHPIQTYICPPRTPSFVW